MKFKNYLVIISVFIIFLCCVGAISAASEDVMNTTVSETDSFDETVSTSNDEQDIGVDSTETASYSEEKNEVTDDEKLSVSEDNPSLTKDNADEKLAAITSSYDLYSIKLNELYAVAPYSKGTISGTISPPPTFMPQYGFKLYIYDWYENIVHVSPSIVGRATSFTYTLPAKTLLPGYYDVYAVNDWDNKIMAESDLEIGGTAVITANNFNGKYMSNTKMTAKITDKVTGKPLTSLGITAVFTKGSTKVSKYYFPDSNGQISFIPPVGVGTWTVTFSDAVGYLSGSDVKTATVKKSTVSIKAYKVTEYKGFKTTLKAVVKSSGKKVNEGKVTFKINGKTYNANVKKGIASVKVKLTKVKTYTFSAKYNGNANLAKSKVVKANAILKNRLKTKVIFSDQSVYADSSKTVTIQVKTTSGKNVANGKLKIVGNGQTQYVTVKNGKAKMSVQGLGMKHFVGFTSAGETYRKSIVQKFKITYVSSTHKYVGSSKKVKVTSLFKCMCGKTSTHTHRAWSGSYYYDHIMKVI